MALTKQNVNFPINGSMDTKSDFASVTSNAQTPNYDLVQDMQYNKLGAAEKRVGTAASPDDLQLTGLATFNNELLAFDGEDSYSRDFVTNRWVNKGTSQTVLTSKLDLDGTAVGGSLLGTPGNFPTYISNAVINNLCLVSSSTGREYTIVDLDTGSTVFQKDIQQNPLSTRYASRKVLSLGNFWYLITAVGAPAGPTTGTYKRVSYLDIGSEVSYGNIFPNTEVFMDAITANGRIYTLTRTAAGQPRIRYVVPGGTPSAAVLMPDTYAQQTGTLKALPNGEILVTYKTADAIIKTRRLTIDLAAQGAYPDIVTDFSVPDFIQKLNIVVRPDFGYNVYANFSPFIPDDSFITRKIEISNMHVASPSTLVDYGYKMMSNVFFYDNKYCYVAAVSVGLKPFYGSFYIVSDEGRTLGRLFFGLGVPVNNIDVSQVSQDKFFSTYLARNSAFDPNKVESVPASTIPHTVSGSFIEKTITRSSQVGSVANQLFIPSSISQVYDGSEFKEAGFFEEPVIFSTPSPLVGPVGLRGGTEYLYAYVYETIGKDGRKIQSAPVFSKGTTSGTTADQDRGLVVKINPLIPTNEKFVNIVVYRTCLQPTSGAISTWLMGSTYHRCFDTVTVAPYSKAVTTTIQDYTRDIYAFDQEVLYTTGGILSNDTTPNCTLATSHRGRIFTNDASDPLRINFSKEAQNGEAIGFNENLFLTVDGEGGNITALKTLDDNLIIFKQRAIFALSGAGPLNTGAQNDYQSPQFLTTDVGCTVADSIVTTPLGLMFKSAKGIYLLRRNLSVDYIGAQVEKYNPLTITSSVLTEDQNEVRFFTQEGTTLVYNYLMQKWSIFSNQLALDAVNYDSKVIYLRTDGKIHTETPGVYTENSSFYKPTLITGWLNFAGVQGFQRIYNFKILGKSNGTHKLRVSIAYDYDENFHNSTIIDPALVSTYYGEGDYGSGVYGGEEGAYQWTVYPEFQKCQAIKIRIEEIESSPATAGFSLSNIAFSVGLKSQLGVTGDAKSFGGK